MKMDAAKASLDLQQSKVDVNEKADIITSCILDAAEKSYPLSKPRKRPPAPWWSEEIAKARLEKRRARRQWKRSNTVANKISLKKHQAKLKRAIKSAKRSSWREFIGSINRDTPSSVVWKRIKAISGRSQTGSSAIAHGDKMVIDEKEQANLFGKHYAAKCSLQDASQDEHLFTDLENDIHTQHDLLCQLDDPCDQPFTKEELELALSELSNSATGEDRIHNQMLKDLPDAGKALILSLVNDIWKEGTYPSSWKVSKIIPLLKPNKDKQEIKSYRPVALTSCLGKLTERLINRRLIWRLHQDQTLPESQCGFRPKSGTIDALLKITEQCHEGLHNKQYTILIFIDLEGAFDKVWWKGLITKAASIGITGNMLKSLRSFLSDRFIKVQVGDQTSENFSIGAGTPQGAVISPTIFNIMMYDLHLLIPELSDLVTYADDGNIAMTHSDLIYLVSCLNKIMEAIDEWCTKWKLILSKVKTEYTVITRKRKHARPLDDLGLQIKGENIRYNKNPKSLGLILDPKLSWKNHIDALVDQCTRRLNLMKVIASKSWGADLSTLRTFYLAFIRSKIGYAAEVWSSCCSSQLERLCRIQNTALRLMLGALKTTPVSAMEIEADIQPLDLFIDSLVLKKRIKAYFMPADSPGALRKSKAPLSFFQRSKRLLKNNRMVLPNKSDPSFSVTAVVNDLPPWDWSPPHINLSLPTDATKSETTDTVLQQLSLEVIHEDFGDSITVYTDGSLDQDKGKAGAGIFIPSENIRVIIPLPPCSILSAELTAIERALQEIECLPSGSSSDSHFVILTDSMSSLHALRSYSPSEYYTQCQSIHQLIKGIPAKITLQWIPSHVGIHGNDEADLLAKLAASSGPVNKPADSISSLQCKVRSSTQDIWRKRWQNGQHGRLYYQIQQKPNPVRYKNIERKDQVTISRLRMQHFPTQSFLHRFNLSDDSTCLLCGKEEETINHMIFKCPELSSVRSFTSNMEWSAIIQNKNDEWSSICDITRERSRRIHARALQPDA